MKQLNSIHVPAALTLFIKKTSMLLKRLPRRGGYILVGAVLGLLVLSVGVYGYFSLRYDGLIYPHILIGPVEVGGLSQDQAKQTISQAIETYSQHWPVTFTTSHQEITIPLPASAVEYDIDAAVNQAFNIGRPFTLKGFNELINLTRQEVTSPLPAAVNPVWLETEAASIAAMIDVPTIPVHLDIQTDLQGKKQAVAVAGQSGRKTNQQRWKDEVIFSLINLTPPNTLLEVEEIPAAISQEQIKEAVDRANILLTGELVLSLNPTDPQAKTWKLTGPDLVKFVRLEGGYDQELIGEYINGVAQAVNQPSKDAKFQFDETSGKVKEFVPAEDGVEVVVDETVATITQALSQKVDQENPSVSIIVRKQPPAVSLSEVNRLGIKEQLGVGVSTYKGSIASRVHNVELAAGRLNGTLIKPGEEFSFNTAVGDVSAATGYQSAYIIRDGRTQLGDGGGLCQDSTTVFRAALNAGLPITSRRGHSYRVGYYEQNAKAGLDATVYSPSTDLKFLNDTPNHILLQTWVDSPNRTLKVILYGTSDGRKATIKDHAVWDITPAPPDVYQDDPTLPLNTIKQIDWKAAGAKAKFTYVVERNGQTIYEKTFVTNYQPWAAVYLKGTKQ